ncbi:MAG: Ku protein [Pseudomonadota bacterium]
MERRDGSRLKQQMISAKSGEVVPKEEIVKGYEFAKNQYVLFEPDELKALEADVTHTIDITEFVKLDQVERILLDKTYFLGPDKGGARAYRLLAEALRDTGRAAVAQYAARGRQYLVLVRPIEDGLLMEQLHYADELKAFEDVPIDEADVKPDELRLAKQLIDQAISEKFEPQKYKDEVRVRVESLIQKKIDGEAISFTPTEEPEHKIIDMMEALKASIAAGDKEASSKPKAAKRAARKPRAKKKKTAK